MRNTQEFIDIQTQFEKDSKNMPVYTLRLDRVKPTDSVPKTVFYDDGRTNELFNAYLYGTSFGKIYYRE